MDGASLLITLNFASYIPSLMVYMYLVMFFVEFNQVLEGDISQRVSERNGLDVRKFAFG